MEHVFGACSPRDSERADIQKDLVENNPVKTFLGHRSIGTDTLSNSGPVEIGKPDGGSTVEIYRIVP